MGLTRAQIRNNILENLTGSRAQSTYYAEEDINDAIQDAYNESVGKTRCQVKKVTLNWNSGQNYYDFKAEGVDDFLGTISIFDHNSNLWLRDDVTIRDFNRIRRDWETWVGYSQFWAPHSFQYTAVCPALQVGVGQFDLWYYAIAPTLVDDTTPTILATDMDILIADYASGDLLESAQELTKAQPYLQRFEAKKEVYLERSHNLAAQQLLLRI